MKETSQCIIDSKTARHSLLSIYHDSNVFLQNLLNYFYNKSQKSNTSTDSLLDDDSNVTSKINIDTNININTNINTNILLSSKNHPIVVANQRCGTWYAYPYANAAHNTHFKSTDGHVNIYNFSLKRINLQFLSTVCMVAEQQQQQQQQQKQQQKQQKDHNQNQTAVATNGDDTTENTNGNNIGAVFIVDGSKTKIQPDSFSRTLPIWCCVLNRLVLAFREKQDQKQQQQPLPNEINNNKNKNHNSNENHNSNNSKKNDIFYDGEEWDTNLYTPSFIKEEERQNIIDIIPRRVQSALDSGIILDEEWFLNTLKKPLRCFWISNSSTNTSTSTNTNSTAPCTNNHIDNWNDLYSTIEQMKSRYTCIICVSVSESGVLENVPQYRPSPKCINSREQYGKGQEEREKQNIDADSDVDSEWYYYTPGAADDHEFGSWSKGLTPALFWNHCHEILFQNSITTTTMTMTIQDTDEAIRKIMKQAKNDRYNDTATDKNKIGHDCTSNTTSSSTNIRNFFDTLGSSCNISIGSRKAGRPPICWDHFDAILNVTELEYDDLSSRAKVKEGKFYLQLNVKEGKKDRTELEKWMAVAMIFIGIHAASSKRRVLVHCAQGKDRSVAVVLAAICIFCRLTSSTTSCNGDGRKELVYHPWCSEIRFQSILDHAEERGLLAIDDNSECDLEFGCSGIPAFLVNLLMGRPGKELLFQYLRKLSSNQTNGLIENDDNEKSSFFATKESLRIALIAIQQYRACACPSRKTMQKLNRFFMSDLND